MNIDVNALQRLPEVSAGIKAPTCMGKKSKYFCATKSCVDTEIRRTVVFDR
jgi:hypothetical protein